MVCMIQIFYPHLHIMNVYDRFDIMEYSERNITSYLFEWKVALAVDFYYCTYNRLQLKDRSHLSREQHLAQVGVL